MSPETKDKRLKVIEEILVKLANNPPPVSTTMERTPSHYLRMDNVF